MWARNLPERQNDIHEGINELINQMNPEENDVIVFLANLSGGRLNGYFDPQHNVWDPSRKWNLHIKHITRPQLLPKPLTVCFLI